MILEFPDLDTLRLVLTSGVVPAEVHAGPAGVGGEDGGPVWVETEVSLANDVRRELRRLGVQGRRSWPSDVARREVLAWVQAFPLVRGRIPAFDDRTPVLFELDDGELLPELVHEILRLGNDRQAFRYVGAETGNGDGEEAAGERVLLRVIGPPYYSLLRAFEDSTGEAGRPTAGVPHHGEPTAYVERRPRVWVEAGYEHPFVDRLQPPPGRVWLLRPPFDWRTLAEAPFRDVYEVLDFDLPRTTVDLADRELSQRLRVPLRLARGGPSEGGELWVLNETGVERLDEFVRSSRDTLLERLSFAVGQGDSGGGPVVVLRSRPGKGPPPVVVLEGLVCRPYLKLPNLFLPAGTRLHPPLRRETVKQLLAADDALVTWLRPEEDGSFTPLQFADTAFRPLSDWVDYVLDREHEPLAAWMRSATFDFEGFVCPEEQAERREQDRERRRNAEDAEAKRRKRDESRVKRRSRPDSEAKAVPRRNRGEDEAPDYKGEQPSERRVVEERLHEVERAFLAADVAADAPERLESWREMARLNGALGHHADAAICWTQAFWEEAQPPADRLWEWYAAERANGGTSLERAREARLLGRSRAATVRPLTADEIDDLLTAAGPAPSRVQALAAYLAWLEALGERPPEVVERLAALQSFLDRHDGLLSVRGSWLAARALFSLTHGDVLALARARDRVLGRLFEHGLRPDRDLPSFLRGTGLLSGDRFRAVRERVVALHGEVRAWSARNLGGLTAPTTRHYVDLIFAFGLARLGEAERCRELLEETQVELHATDAIHGWLVRAFAHRIETALAGKPTSTPLPEELLTDLEAAFSPNDEDRRQMSESRLKEFEKSLKLERYKVDRLRNASRILEPHEKIDPYRRYNKGFSDDLARDLVELSEIADRGELTARVSELASRDLDRADRVRLLAALLEVGPRVGETLSERMLAETVSLLPEVGDVVQRALLLERGLYVAAHFDRRDEVDAFVGRLHELLETQSAGDLETLKSLHSLLSESFRGLRRLGMRDDITRLLERLETLVAGLAVPRSRSRNVAEWNNVALESSRMKLQVAAGWFYFGRDQRAWPILDAVRTLILGEDLMRLHRTTLTCAYVAALGHAPVDEAVPRLSEVFRDLDGIHDNYTTNTHYSVSQLNVVEATVLAMVGDDMVLDPGARRWLDEDEYLVRRRIHADVRAAMHATQ
jgi:cellulose synthase operon protein C